MIRTITHPDDLSLCCFPGGECICGAKATQCEGENCECCVTENRSPEPRCLLAATVTLEEVDGPSQLECCTNCAAYLTMDSDAEWTILH